MTSHRSHFASVALAVATMLLVGTLPARATASGKRQPVSELQFTLPKRGSYPEVHFERRDTSTGHRPAVAVRGRGGAWRTVPLAGTRFENSSWEYAGRARRTGVLWGVTQLDVEGPGDVLELVRSPASGTAWVRVATIRKPVFHASFVSLALAANGSGRLVMHLDDGLDPSVPGGFYVSATTDAGRHWTPPALAAEEPGPFANDDLEAALRADASVRNT